MFHYLAEWIRSCDASGKVCLSTQDENVIRVGDYKLADIESVLMKWTLRYSYTLLIAQCMIMKVAICTVDSDMVIISVSHFHDLYIEELWMSFGMGNHIHHTRLQTACKLRSQSQ